MYAKLDVVKWGVVLAILTILLGFILGAAMGGGEAQIKGYWKSSAQPVLSTIYNNDNQKVDMMVERSWKMLQRAHMHAAAIGATSLVLMYILACLNVSNFYKKLIAFLLGLGSIGYSFSWLYTAFAAPAVGSIPATKASVHILAAASIGMLLFGTVVVLGLSAKALFFQEQTYIENN